MKQFALFTAALITMLSIASAQDWAKARLENSPRHGEWVKLNHDKRQVNAFITYPEVKGKATAVVVIHEIFGLSDWVRSVTDQLAEAGYIAIAPDLLSGMGPNGGGTKSIGGPDDVRQAISSLPPEQIMTDLDAAVDYVSKLPSSNGKVVVMGFCWGGGQAFRFAEHNQQIKAAFSFYGPIPDPSTFVNINIPVYGFYGENDSRITSSVPATKKAMNRDHKIYEPVIYPGAGHGFMRLGEAPDANEANKKARDEAWQRVKKLLAKIN